MAIRRRVHEILDVANPGDLVSRVVDVGILSLIILNVAALVLESLPAYRERFGAEFSTFEQVSLILFTAEYVLRLWSCTEAPDYASPIGGRIRFALTPLLIIDLIAVLPFYISLGVDTRFIRILRLLKLARYFDSMRMFQRVLFRKRKQLLVTLMILSVMLVFTSCLIFTLEKDTNDQFDSIPSAMWWSIVTLTTVGYGDTSPVTPLGRVAAGIVAIIGISMFALPTAILGAGFLEEVEAKGKAPADTNKCPHCGKEL